MLTFKRISSAALGGAFATVTAGCAAPADNAVERSTTEESSEAVQQAPDLVTADESNEENTDATAQAVVRRVGGHHGGAYRRGTYRGAAVYGTGGVVYGAGGVYRAGRYSSGGVWITCDDAGNCW